MLNTDGHVNDTDKDSGVCSTQAAKQHNFVNTKQPVSFASEDLPTSRDSCCLSNHEQKCIDASASFRQIVDLNEI
jgi:hypothetical protein